LIDLSFYPNQTRAKAIDARMHNELAKSLEYVITQIKLQSPGSETCQHADKLQSVISLLQSGQRVSPAVFASYYQLVLSILAGEDFTEKIYDLIDTVETRETLVFKDFSAAGLGSEKMISLYTASLDTDDKLSFGFFPPKPEESNRTKASVMRAITLMRQLVPDLAAEFEAIVIEVLLAAADEPDAPRFDGASSYMLWGALALSVDDEKSDLEMIETLAHEAGHSILFGLTIEEPLVKNDDDDVFESPLRPDPRPMDGIYHATFVSARMHNAMQECKKSGLLKKEQLIECETYLDASKQAFIDGYSVVADSGDLTATGKTIIDNAYEYMSSIR